MLCSCQDVMPDACSKNFKLPTTTPSFAQSPSHAGTLASTGEDDVCVPTAGRGSQTRGHQGLSSAYYVTADDDVDDTLHVNVDSSSRHRSPSSTTTTALQRRPRSTSRSTFREYTSVCEQKTPTLNAATLRNEGRDVGTGRFSVQPSRLHSSQRRRQDIRVQLDNVFRRRMK